PTPPLSTVSLHDALPISTKVSCAKLLIALLQICRTKHLNPISLRRFSACVRCRQLRPTPCNSGRQWSICCLSKPAPFVHVLPKTDRKSTRLNSSHVKISY